jgi:phenylacetate-CoA ligase
VRLAGDRAYLTVKGISVGASRAEFEYAIPLEDAREMLDQMCEDALVKTRYVVPHEGHDWEVDEFGGANAGLVLAEIELDDEAELFAQPSWVGDEVTHDPRYYNANLARAPLPQPPLLAVEPPAATLPFWCSRRVTEAIAAFTATPLDKVLERHLREDPRAAALALFHAVAQEVPAYGRFLAEQGKDPRAVRTFADFESVPPVTKANYFTQHPLADLCRRGAISACDMIAVSSGSTGKPAFWPRFVTDELGIARRFEQVFRDAFAAHERRTLAVVCFALGTWVGGMFTTSCCRHLAAKGYPVTVITPGNVKEEILRVVGELGPSFDQVVLLGYPPFLRDVVDQGRARGVEWARLRVRLVTAGEVFSEEWRTLMAERIGSAEPAYDIASLYGTADAGVLGNETPLSIAIRRFLASRPDAARAIFGEDRLPTLVQYDPMSRFFEAKEGTLLFTGDGGVPLVRYAILDTGGVLPYEALMHAVASYGFDPLPLLPRGGAKQLPFVYVFGRSDFTVSFYGANVFPENVTVGLEQPQISPWVTGKFVIQVEHGERDALLAMGASLPNPRSRLQIVVELAPGEHASGARRDAAASAIEEQLCRLNSEFKSYVPDANKTPDVTLVPAGDPAHFPVGVKHRYTRRPT